MSDDETATAILLERNSSTASYEPSTHPRSDTSCSFMRHLYHKSCVIVFASAIAAIGGVLFGYDVGVISGALLQLEKEWVLSCYNKQLVVSSMLFGALAASCIGGFIVDTIGRKWTIICNSIIFIVGALVQALSLSFSILILGRIIVGFAVSLSAISECVYISEIAPADRRGLLVGLNELGITFGFLLAYTMNYFLADTDSGWRYMLGASVIPATVQLVGMLFLPPSPHYLMLRRREHQAEKVLSNLRGQPDVRQELTNIRLALDAEKDQGCRKLCSFQDNMHYRMVVAMGLMLFQQLTGQPNVLYYASVIFESVGFCSASDATFASLVLGIIKLLATAVSMLLVDKAGRRVFLLLGALLMAVSICSVGLVARANPAQFKLEFCKDELPGRSNSSLLATPVSILEAENVSTVFHRHHLDGGAPNEVLRSESACSESSKKFSVAAKWFSLISLMLYVASYSLGFGPVTWLVLSEIFPTAIKGRAVAAASILNWGSNILISSTFLDVMDVLSVGITFITYGAFCFLSAIFVFLVVPETKNKSLNQLSREIMKSNPAEGIFKNLSKIPCCSWWHKTQRYHQVSAREAIVNETQAETSA